VKLNANGHRVVIFSQYTRTLDILDDFLTMRGWRFTRLDGSMNRVQRMININVFNSPSSPYFCFLMTTRAGGLGVNLQTADTVGPGPSPSCRVST
jgi:SNF2 family DNA or RNA helicase